MKDDFFRRRAADKQLHGLGDLVHRVALSDDEPAPCNSHSAFQAWAILAGLCRGPAKRHY
jgi:hypothetical protein